MLRVCLLVLLANICTVSYSDGRLYAGVSSSLEQKILDQKVSLNFKNKPIKDVLEEIKKQVGVGFAITSEIEDEIGKVSVNIEDVPLFEALEKIFEGEKLGHKRKFIPCYCHEDIIICKCQYFVWKE